MLRRRKAPEINAGSMADVAFLLLTFFLVATTMGDDRGIARLLSPVQQSIDKAKPIEVKRRNVLQIFIDGSDRTLVDERPVAIDELAWVIENFIRGDGPERETEQIELLGPYDVSRGVISLRSDSRASYDAYIAVQNALTRAFGQLRNELATRKFSRRFTELDHARRDAVRRAIPMRISESEPK
ncbi:MAG: biopolymer transporter ExbD [Rikenellaceae bacterium]|jgi:biopolymer transport protein ExbD|nr:biopolymer transporter ExbD [Rikenellaceae bacterium]